MVAKDIRNIRSGNEYEKYFPKTEQTDPIVKQGSNVADTVKFVQKIASEYRSDTAKIAPLFKASTLRGTLANIWQFVYHHIRYKIDTPGLEQVRRPSRAWADRAQGVDCDCYSTFISSILHNLGIPHVLRITAYDNKPYFQHIYPIVPTDWNAYNKNKANRMTYIVLDDVKDAFDDEQAFSKFQDKPITKADMDLQFLNGFGDTGTQILGLNLADAVLDGLGKARRRKGKKVEAQTLAPAQVQAALTNPAAPLPTTNTPLVPPSPMNFTAPTMSLNKGTLANGMQVKLYIDESNPNAGVIADTEWINTYSGSAFGKKIVDKQVLINGTLWQGGKAGLCRFIVKRGQLRGVNTKGEYFVSNASGQLVKVQGAIIRNPGVALGGTEDETFGSLLSIDSTGSLRANEDMPSRLGLWIPYDVFLQLWQKRGQGTNGLGAIAAILGDAGMTSIENVVMGLGDFEMDGMDDINGIVGIDGDDIEVSGIDSLNSIADYFAQDLNGFSGEDSYLTMNGLGAARRIRTKRSRGRNVATEAANSASPSAPVNTARKIGFYIPLNTLRNMFKIRAAQIMRLQQNGHKVTSGEIPMSIDQMQVSGFGSIDSWFSNAINKVASTVSKASPVLNFVPFVGPFASVAVKEGSKLVANATAPRPVEAVATQPQAQQDYVSKYNAEASMAFNHAMTSETAGLGNPEESLEGLEGVVSTSVDWVKKNPIVATGGALALGTGAYLLYDHYKKGGRSTKSKGSGLAGTSTKKKSTKPKTKRSKNGRFVKVDLR